MYGPGCANRCLSTNAIDDFGRDGGRPASSVAVVVPASVVADVTSFGVGPFREQLGDDPGW